MSVYICENYQEKNVSCIKLGAGKYSAIISPEYGSSVWRMRDEESDMEIFRYNSKVTAKEINKAREIWGLPTLYLPNRYDGGKIKTSDGEYHLPINESRLNNHLHGWIHKREHNVEKIYSDGEKAVAVTSFTHDENDAMFSYFPIKFKLTYTFELSEKGLLQSIVLENLSEKYLPVSLCTHTCINSPIVCGGKQSRLRLSVPIKERCELNNRFLPTERLLSLDTHDMRYKKGVMKPVLHSISNDMYTAGENVLNGNPFNGVIITDLENGRKICNEVSKEFKFWNIWNDKGYNGYFCPEPMTAMINSPNLSLPPEISGYSELAPGEKYSCWQRFFTL